MINDYKNGGLKMVHIASFTTNCARLLGLKNTLTILIAENGRLFFTLNLGNKPAN